jgi:hypothetical protein
MYGNPLDGRNPQDFDKCNPYGNPLPRDNDNVNQYTDPYGNPIGQDGKNNNSRNLGGGSFHTGDDCIQCPYCKARLKREMDAKKIPDVVTVKTAPSPKPQPESEPEIHVEPEPAPEDLESKKHERNTKSPSSDGDDAAGRRKLRVGTGDIYERKKHEDEEVDLRHAETIKREYKTQVPEWTKVKLKKTRPGAGSRRKPPPKEREKFSLPTFHQPRMSQTVTAGSSN